MFPLTGAPLMPWLAPQRKETHPDSSAAACEGARAADIISGSSLSEALREMASRSAALAVLRMPRGLFRGVSMTGLLPARRGVSSIVGSSRPATRRPCNDYLSAVTRTLYQLQRGARAMTERPGQTARLQLAGRQRLVAGAPTSVRMMRAIPAVAGKLWHPHVTH
jgi:hypothetical protein